MRYDQFRQFDSDLSESDKTKIRFVRGLIDTMNFDKKHYSIYLRCVFNYWA